MAVKDGKERKMWFDHQRSLCAEPCFKETARVEGGPAFARTLPKICPQCSEMFFAYQRVGNEREPYQVDPEPDLSAGTIGQRETCGSPKCWDDELAHQQSRWKFYHRPAAAPEPEPVVTPLRRKGSRALVPIDQVRS